MTCHLILCLVLLPHPEQDPLALFRQWCRSPSPELRLQAVRTLRGQQGSASRAALLSLLSDPHVGVREAVRREIAFRQPDEGPDLAREIAALKDPKARVEGVRAVVQRKEDATLFATDPDPEVRARALGTGRVARPQVEAALRSRDARTRALALEVLGEPALAAPFLGDAAEEARIACARVTDDPVALEKLVKDRSWRVRLAVVMARHGLTRAAAARVLAAAGGSLRVVLRGGAVRASGRGRRQGARRRPRSTARDRVLRGAG